MFHYFSIVSIVSSVCSVSCYHQKGIYDIIICCYIQYTIYTTQLQTVWVILTIIKFTTTTNKVLLVITTIESIYGAIIGLYA